MVRGSRLLLWASHCSSRVPESKKLHFSQQALQTLPAVGYFLASSVSQDKPRSAHLFMWGLCERLMTSQSVTFRELDVALLCGSLMDFFRSMTFSYLKVCDFFSLRFPGWLVRVWTSLSPEHIRFKADTNWWFMGDPICQLKRSRLAWIVWNCNVHKPP